MPEIPEKFKTAQEYIEYEIIKHAVNMERIKAGQVNLTRQFLNELAEGIVETIQQQKLDDTENTKELKGRQKRLIQEADSMIDDFYKDIKKVRAYNDTEIAALEMEFNRRLINNAVGVEMNKPTPTTEQTRRLVESIEIDARPLSWWWNKQEEKAKKELQRNVRQGMGMGETTQQIVKRVKDKGGWLDRRKGEAESLVRTEIAQINGDAAMETFRQNKDLIEAVEHNSVLDSRTSPVCVFRDGLRWTFPDLDPIEHSIPFMNIPLHWRCRTKIVPVLVSFDKILGAQGKFNRDVFEQKLRADGPRKGQSSKEYEAEIQRIADRAERRLTKPKQGDQKTSEAFIRKNPSRAIDMLGWARGEMFLQGRITFKQALDSQTGRPLLVEQLVKKYGWPERVNRARVSAGFTGKETPKISEPGAMKGKEKADFIKYLKSEDGKKEKNEVQVKRPKPLLEPQKLPQKVSDL